MAEKNNGQIIENIDGITDRKRLKEESPGGAEGSKKGSQAPCKGVGSPGRRTG